tara:strand:- start:2052 stop:2312 length:261 start_codon:yes stop_codon:yes gene_type:complete
MPDQDKINNVAKEITDIIDKAKLELAKDLLKLKKELSDDEFIQALDKIDIKAILNTKINKAKQIYIQQHKVVLEETIPFGDLNGSK